MNGTNALAGSTWVRPQDRTSSNALMPGASSDLNKPFPGAALQPKTPPTVLQGGLPPQGPPMLPPGAQMAPQGGQMSPPAGAPMPGLAMSPSSPPNAAGANQHPADDMGKLSQQLSGAKLLPSKLKALAQVEDHIAQATGTLLQKPGDITQQDLDKAVDTAVRGVKVDRQAGEQFAKSLPSVSDQVALRKALMVQRERSIRGLVVIHAEAQSRGIQIPPAPSQSGVAGR